MRDHLQLIALTVVLTVLIWVYADRAGFEDQTIDVNFVVKTRDEYVPRIRGVQSRPFNELPVRVTLRGPKSAVHRLDATATYTCEVHVTEPLDTRQTYTIDVASRIRQWDLVMNQALEFVYTERETIEFDVDRYVRMDVDVVTDSGALTQTLDGRPVVQPSTVQVTLLESERDALLDPSAPITLNIVEALNSPQHAGRTEFDFTANLPNRWQNNATIRCEPNQVRIRVNRRLETQRVHFAPISLEVKAPVGFFEEGYYLEFVDVTGTRPHAIQDVYVQVPVDKEGRLEARDIEAYIRIEEEDLPAASVEPVSTAPGTITPLSKPVIFRLPDGFEDFSIETQKREVEFHIRRLPLPAAAESAP